jgi:8-oxo-dGTP diphosphatase
MSQAGRWELPGGKVEAGETDEAALARELAEELRIRVRVGTELGRTLHPPDGPRLDLRAYACATEDTPVLTEHDALRWLDAPAAWTVDWTDADVPLLRTMLRHGLLRLTAR